MKRNKELSRRDFIRGLATSSVTLPILSACGGGFTTGKTESDFVGTLKVADLGAENSNVLFIAVDDLNDWISPLGGYKGKVYTPNFDRIAAMGTTFQNAYCAVPWCAPSRAATLTGVAPSKSGYYGDVDDIRDVPTLRSVETIPAFYKRMGYKTIGGGKIFHGAYINGVGAPTAWYPQGQQNQSWDQYYPLADELRPNSSVPNSGLNIPLGNFDWSGDYYPPESGMADLIMANWAANILRQKSSMPLFLAVGFYKPHLPWYAPKKYFDMYPLESIQLPDYLDSDMMDIGAAAKELIAMFPDYEPIIQKDPTNKTWWKKSIQAYLACVTFTDACLGVLLDGLAQGPNASNTTVVLWSDNGYQLGEKQTWRKFKLWEKSARVPLIIASPTRSNGGKVCRKPVSLLDIYPTLAELTVKTKPAHLDGNSLVPLLLNPQSPWCYGALTSYPQAGNGAQLHRSIRTEYYRYILYSDGSEELYDHRVDSREIINLMHPMHGKIVESRPIANVLRALLPPIAKAV